MFKRSSAQKAKLSWMSLLILSLSGLVIFLIALDRWLAQGAYSRKTIDFCQSLAASCRDSFFSWASLIQSPLNFLILLGVISFLLVGMRTIYILAYSFLLSSKSKIVNSRKVKEVLKEMSPQGSFKICISPRFEPFALTVGFFQPTIYLSQGLVKKLSKEELKAVISHEYAHILRKDNLFIFLGLLLKNFLFFLPLSHFLYRFFTREKEYAADELAAEITGDRLTLAQAIIKVKRLSQERKSLPAYVASFYPRATTESRVRKILGEDVSGFKKEAKGLVISLIISFLLVGFLAQVALASSQKSINNGNCPTLKNCINQNQDCCSNQ